MANVYALQTAREGAQSSVAIVKGEAPQAMVPDADDRVGVQLGYATDMTSYGSEVLMGAPGEIRIDGAKQTDGSVYRYTNAGGKYGSVIGTTDTALTTDRKLLINGLQNYFSGLKIVREFLVLRNFQDTTHKGYTHILQKDIYLTGSKKIIKFYTGLGFSLRRKDCLNVNIFYGS